MRRAKTQTLGITTARGTSTANGVTLSSDCPSVDLSKPVCLTQPIPAQSQPAKSVAVTMDAVVPKSIKRKSLTIELKIDIINKLENGEKNYKLCKEYQISSSTISTILENKDKIKEHYKELKVIHGDTKRKRVNGPRFETIEKIVYAWLCQKRIIGEPVCGQAVQEKAKFFHSRLKQEGRIPKNEREFKASEGWLSRFKNRYGLKTLSGRGEKTWDNTQARDRYVANFTQFLLDNDYELDDVYNADETGLEFNSLPETTSVLGIKKEPGHEATKDRLTIMVCANASGSHRIPLLVIGKAARPRCFRRRQQLPLEYTSQDEAWMNREIFQHWFRNVFLKNVRESKPHARIILLLDHAPTHPLAEELNAIDDNCQVKYLPPNVTRLIRPMDQGVISALKRHYKMGFLREVLSRYHNSRSDFIQCVKEWTVLDCMTVLREAWNAPTPSSLRNSWKKLIPTMVPNAVDNEPSNAELASLLNCIPGGGVCSGRDVTGWIDEEPKLPVFEIMSDDQLLNTCGALRLPLLKNEKNKESDTEEDENIDGPVDESPKMGLILKAAQCILDWTRGHEDFTDEERSGIIIARDIALDSLLAENSRL